MAMLICLRADTIGRRGAPPQQGIRERSKRWRERSRGCFAARGRG